MLRRLNRRGDLVDIIWNSGPLQLRIRADTENTYCEAVASYGNRQATGLNVDHKTESPSALNALKI